MYSWCSFHVFLVEHFLTETLVCLFMIQLLCLICLGFQTHFYFPFSSLEKFHFLSLVSCSFQSFIQFKLSGRTRQGGGQSKARQGKAGETGERTFDGAPSFMQLLLLAHLNIWHTWTFGTLEHLAQGTWANALLTPQLNIIMIDTTQIFRLVCHYEEKRKPMYNMER